MPRDFSKRLRDSILPLAGLGLILCANAKIGALCNCSGESRWSFYLLSYRVDSSTIWSAHSFLLSVALGVQIWLCLLIPNHNYLKIGIVLGVVVILIAPDMSLLADNRAHPFSVNQWQDAITARSTRVFLLDFLALFVNLATGLYRSNAYILSKI